MVGGVWGGEGGARDGAVWGRCEGGCVKAQSDFLTMSVKMPETC